MEGMDRRRIGKEGKSGRKKEGKVRVEKERKKKKIDGRKKRWEGEEKRWKANRMEGKKSTWIKKGES